MTETNKSNINQNNKQIENNPTSVGQVNRDRKTRIPRHAQQNNQIKAREGYERRLVNEKLGRIESFLEAGWTPVDQENQTDSIQRIQDPKNMGTLYRPVVNPSGSVTYTHGIWMEIPKELYDEDQIAKLRKVKAKEDQINPKNSSDPNTYGGLEYES